MVWVLVCRGSVMLPCWLELLPLLACVLVAVTSRFVRLIRWVVCLAFLFVVAGFSLAGPRWCLWCAALSTIVLPLKALLRAKVSGLVVVCGMLSLVSGCPCLYW